MDEGASRCADPDDTEISFNDCSTPLSSALLPFPFLEGVVPAAAELDRIYIFTCIMYMYMYMRTNTGCRSSWTVAASELVVYICR